VAFSLIGPFLVIVERDFGILNTLATQDFERCTLVDAIPRRFWKGVITESYRSTGLA
jgi:hypothetical protein